MAYDIVHTAPQAVEFTPLSAHQEQTPGSFFGGKAVLHLHCGDAKLRIARDELASQPDFAALEGTSQAATDAEGGIADIAGIGVWVASRHLTLWSTATQIGLQIPYTTITLHAQDGNAVLLQLSLSDPNMTADEDLEAIQLRIVPNAAGTGPGASAEHNGFNAQTNGQSRVLSPEQQLYDAISACQELNPDPNPESDGEEGGEGGFDETAPGATGWITSENMAEFVDEDGNFRMPAGMTVVGGEEDEDGDDVNGHANGLGAGAGTRRTAAEADADDGAQDESKWQRTR